MLEESARRSAPSDGLDLGAGGGHVTYRLARHATRVTACDLSADMLAAVDASARERGLTNVDTRVAGAEALPFEAGTFDFLGCRFSAHHWQGFEAGRRVLASGAPAIFIDAIATGTAAMDTHLQAVELLRDTSHVRDYRAAEWLEALSRSGFGVRSTKTWRLRMDFPSWIARMRTPPANRQAIRALQESASTETVDHFAIEPDGSFLLDVLLVEAEAT